MMDNQGNSNENDFPSPSAEQNFADLKEKSPEKEPDYTESELCQQLTDTLSISSELTHTLTPIPSLTDRTISISRNTNSLTRFSEDDDNIDEYNVKLTNWTTRSFCTSTEDMISSGIFDSDIEGSLNEGTIESLPRESISTNEDSAYKWHDISASEIWDEDDATLVPYNRKPRIIVESSSEDEPRKLRKPLTFFNVRRSEASENSYPHSSNRTYSNLEDFPGSSTLTSEEEDSEGNHSLPSIYSVSTVTPMTLSDPEDSPAATCSSISTDVSIADNIFDEAMGEGTENIEHNMIATRYGLPYEVVECGCHAETLLQRNRQTGIKLCKSGSCHKFEEQFGELDGRAIRLWHTTKRLNGYKKACRIYKIFMSKPDPHERKEFLKADYMLKVNYPHYWVHLNEKYITFMTDEEYQRENNRKEEVVESCQRVLKEQGFFSQHYQVAMRDSGENVKFSVDYRHLHHDFKMACEFLMKEYPNLFQHLMEKFNFGELAGKRLSVDENRKRYIEYSKKSRKSLEELENAHFQESLAKIKKRNQV